MTSNSLSQSYPINVMDFCPHKSIVKRIGGYYCRYCNSYFRVELVKKQSGDSVS